MTQAWANLITHLPPKNGQPLPDGLKQRIRELLKTDISEAKIGRMVGCSPAAVNRLRRLEGLR